MVVLRQVDAWSWLGLHLAPVARILDADKEMCAQRGMKNVHGAFPTLFLARPPPTTPMQVILEAHAAMFVWLGARGDRDLLGTTCKKYSLHIGKKKILGQRHGLQNTTLISYLKKYL